MLVIRASLYLLQKLGLAQLGHTVSIIIHNNISCTVHGLMFDTAENQIYFAHNGGKGVFQVSSITFSFAQIKIAIKTLHCMCA